MGSRARFGPRYAEAVSAWTAQADVVVLGHGGGGLTAAVEAGREGADVLVLEKTTRGGGTTEKAGGYFYLGGGTPLQDRHDVSDSPENMFDYLAARNPNTSTDRIRAFVDESVDLYHWLEALGLEFGGPLIEEKTMEDSISHLGYTGSETAYPYDLVADPAPRGHKIAEGGGKLFERLEEAAASLGVETRFETEARRLILDHETGRIVGVQASRDGEHFDVRARRGVVVATSGFSFNTEMIGEFAPEYPDKGNPLGTFFIEYPDVAIHDGSGINMARAVGAKTVNMDAILPAGFIYPYEVYPPDDGSLNRALVSGIVVNAQGRRFINEDRYGVDVMRRIVEEEHAEEIPGNPASAHLLLDDDLFQMGGGKPPKEAVSFDPTTLVSADSVAALAGKIDIPRAVLEDTVSFYNEQARESADPEHHKAVQYLEPLDTPPYYAYYLRPASFFGAGIFYHTLGGLKVSLDGEVLDTGDEPIEGLYAASQAVSGVAGENYESGMSLAELVFYGRRAGRAVASNSD